MMVGPRARGDSQRATGKPHPQREVDVLVVEEELRSEAAEALELLARNREARPGAEARLGIRVGLRDRLARPARPGDPREVDDTAPRVHELPPLGSDERLPRRPARAVGERRGDRLAPALGDDGVGVEEDQELALRLRRAAVARGRKAVVRLALDHTRAGRRIAHDLERLVAGRVVDHDQLVAVARARARAHPAQAEPPRPGGR